jgi:hypothetical protein
MVVVTCPQCSARVEFKAEISILAVCESCQSTLMRDDMNVANIGKMAELKPDASPIQLGVEGKYAKNHFTVIGRIQMQYENGIWNEWYLWFDDGRTGWLSDAQCLYAVTFLKEIERKIPLSGLGVGAEVGLEKNRTVVNIEDARCIAGQGELPFKVDAGYEAPVVDLHGEGMAFGTLDYSESEEQPLVFLGEYVEFENLHLSGLRELEDVLASNRRAKSARCPQCQAPITVRGSGQTVVAVCEHCNSILDITDETFRILKQSVSNIRIKPTIPLGTRGIFRGQKFEVIGFQRRCLTVQRVNYRWDEYLLFNPYVGFRWLTEYQGHWNVVQQTTYRPETFAYQKKIHHDKVFKHFQNGNGVKTEYVLGEFYWQVQAGETYLIEDYIAPPEMLSIEKSKKEFTWSIGTYVEPGEIKAAFSPLKMPSRKGVYSNQPSPYGSLSSLGITAAVLCFFAFLIQGVFMSVAQNKRVQDANFVFVPHLGNNAHVTPVFNLDGRDSNVVIRSKAGVGNSWVFLNMALVNEDTGTAYDFGREISYYYGSDSDGSWSEGSQSDEMVLPSVPAGHYYLRVEPEGDVRTDYSISVYRDVPQLTPFLLALGLLLIFPGFISWRSYAFERARWAEGDHPWGND